MDVEPPWELHQLRRVFRAGRVLFAGGLIGIGLLNVLSSDFAFSWQPVPPWVPARAALAVVSGAILLVAGCLVFVRRFAVLGTLGLGASLLCWIVLLRLPLVVAHARTEAEWLGFGETLLWAVGAAALFHSVRGSAAETVRPGPAAIVTASGRGMLRVGIQLLAGLALVPIGLSHFFYPAQTAALVPPWLSYQAEWGYLTGAAHLATALALLSGVLVPVAGLLEGLMLAAFTVLVWFPRVGTHLGTRRPWTAMLVSLSMSGAMWLIAYALRDPAWRLELTWRSRTGVTSSRAVADAVE